MRVKNNKIGQNFSIDVLVVIVIILLGVSLLVVNQVNNVKDTNEDIEKAQDVAAEQSKVIFTELKNENIIDSENNVDVEKLMQLDLDQLRSELGIGNQFCIVFEKDGKLVKIDADNNVNGIGYSSIEVNGVPCVAGQ